MARCVLRTMYRVKNKGGSQNKRVVQDTANEYVKAEKMFVRKIETQLRSDRRLHGWNNPVESFFSLVHDSCCCHRRYKDVQEDKPIPRCCCGVPDEEIESDLKKFGLDVHMGICGKGYWRLALGQYIRGRQQKELPNSAGPNLAGSSPKRVRLTNNTMVRGFSTDQRSEESIRPKRTCTQNAVHPDPSVSSPSDGHIPVENADNADDDSEGSSHFISQKACDDQLLGTSINNIGHAFEFRVPGHVRRRENAIWFCIPCTEIRFEETPDKTRKVHFDYNAETPVFLQIDAVTCSDVCSKCDSLGRANFPTKLPVTFAGSSSNSNYLPGPSCPCVKAFFKYAENCMNGGEQNGQLAARSTLVHYLMKHSPPLIGLCETRYTGVRVSMYEACV